jgi:hypothetical protein
MDKLKEYRDSMEAPMDLLAAELTHCGLDDQERTDATIVEIAARKLRMLHDMVLATGLHPDLLKAAMNG